MRKKVIVLPLVLVLTLAMVLGICTTSYAKERISTDQGMRETISDNGAEEDSGNGGNAGPVGEEDSGNGGNAGPTDEEDSGNGGNAGPADEEDSGNGGNAGPVDDEEEQELPEFLLDVEDRQKQILIGSAQELCDLAEAVNNGRFVEVYDTTISNAEIILANDIDLSGFQSGGGFTPIGIQGHAFKGEFNGNGFTISNLTINREESFYQGLFGIVGAGAYVHDIRLTGVQISGGALIGGIAGVVEFARIKNCYVEGEIYANDTLAGGIVGGALESLIEGCETTGKVTAVLENAGGIAGQACFNNCIIRDCWSGAKVTSKWGAGGIAGTIMNATMEECRFSGGYESNSDASGSMVGCVEEFDLEGLTPSPLYEASTVIDVNDVDDNGSAPPPPEDTALGGEPQPEDETEPETGDGEREAS